MDDKVCLRYKNYYLRTLTVNDVSEKYLKWVNDPEVTQYLEIRYNSYTMEKLCEYVRAFENTRTKFFFWSIYQ